MAPRCRYRGGCPRFVFGQEAAVRPPPVRDSCPSAERLEVISDDVGADRAPECSALQIGVAEVETDEDACPVDVLDHVVETLVVTGRAGDATVERERNLVGAEERIERLDDRGAVAGV